MKERISVTGSSGVPQFEQSQTLGADSLVTGTAYPHLILEPALGHPEQLQNTAITPELLRAHCKNNSAKEASHLAALVCDGSGAHSTADLLALGLDTVASAVNIYAGRTNNGDTVGVVRKKTLRDTMWSLGWGLRTGRAAPEDLGLYYTDIREASISLLLSTEQITALQAELPFAPRGDGLVVRERVTIGDLIRGNTDYSLLRAGHSESSIHTLKTIAEALVVGFEAQ